MANVSIQFGCGCGLVCRTIEEATNHCDDTGHIMTISGQIKPEASVIKQKQKVTSSKVDRPARPAQKATPVLVEEINYGAAEFSALKARLRRKTGG